MIRHSVFTRRAFLKTAGITAATASLGGLGLLTPARTEGATQIRPISDFLATQGTFCFPDGMGGCLLFVPPAPNFLGWNSALDQTPVRFAGVDYAAVANNFFGNVFGTEVDGTIIERPLKDGRAEVRVLLDTKNANTWVIELDLEGDVLVQVANKPTLFGHRPHEGGGLALGDSFLEVVFINTAPGATLPDLIQLFNFPEEGQEAKFVGFQTQADGPLTADFGVPEGTPGRCKITQTGLFMTQFKGATADGFPVERIDLHVVGK